MKPIHPIVYKCNDFIFYIEEWKGINVLHITINRFSHNVYKKMLMQVKKLCSIYGTLFGYGEDEQTYKLMRMAGFKDSDLFIYNSNNKIRRTLCLQQR